MQCIPDTYSVCQKHITLKSENENEVLSVGNGTAFSDACIHSFFMLCATQ
jgi:hypothetical protein